MANLPPKIRWAVFLGIALLALAIRLPQLGERPMHTDEAVNAYITGRLLEGNTYQYDPRDRHGPALYPLALPVAHAAGAKSLADLNETTVRLGAVIAGVLTVLLFALAARPAGWLAAGIASFIFAIGPLSVYYNRYFIHESLFVAATLGFLLSTWRVVAVCEPASSAWSAGPPEGGTPGNPNPARHRYGAAIRAGGWAGLMLACKETAFLNLAALAVAAVLCWMLTATCERAPGARVCDPQQRPNVDGDRNVVRTEAASVAADHRPAVRFRRAEVLVAAALAVLSFLVVVLVFYTWGGQHWQGPLDLVRSIPGFASRAEGQGHEKPFDYYFALLAGGWGGLPVLALAVAGALTILKRPTPGEPTDDSESRRFFRFICLYTVAISLVYSAIPYKTPWLALNLWLPIALLAGRAVACVWVGANGVWPRAVIGLAVCSMMAALGRDTWQRAFVDPAGERNPYAYAHTGEDLLRLPSRVRQLAQQNPAGDKLRIAVVAADPWPLPWYLRHFPQTGYWQPSQDPGPADLYITMAEPPPQLQPRLAQRRPEYFGLRPGVLIVLWSPSPEPSNE